MNDPDPAGPRSGPAGDPTSRLRAAILRISQSLDLATVLEEAVESARALTGARVGVMTTFDERGRVRDFVISGLPPEQRRKMVAWPDGPRLFEHHRGEHLGNFVLGDKKDGEAFTAEDEEILVLFASQAATAIANARTHRDVERARADLEALVETSPVGVVVFDSGTGRAVSLNLEAVKGK